MDNEITADRENAITKAMAKQLALIFQAQGIVRMASDYVRTCESRDPHRLTAAWCALDAADNILERVGWKFESLETLTAKEEGGEAEVPDDRP